MSNEKLGILFMSLAYLLWGIFPIYWKMLEHVSSEEILAHRIIWSFIFMIVLISFQNKLGLLWKELKSILHKPKVSFSLVLSSLFISLNWFVYIWAVNHERVLEASLGYYINPIVSVFLGMIILKERMNKGQQLAFVLSTVGVLISTIHYGQIPFVSLILAITFGFYGLTKKMTKLSSTFGLTLETLIIFPIGILYVYYLQSIEESVFFQWKWDINLLLIGAGVATALPLLLFALGAIRIPLYMIGVLQYIAPSITFVLGVFLYHEPFTTVDLLTFTFIWCGIIVFTLSQTKFMKRIKVKIKGSYEL